MPKLQAVIDELKKLGKEKTRIIYSRHGMDVDRVLGVSVADLKVIAKTIQGQQELAYELYSTGVMEAMYLAGMAAKGAHMNRKQLQSWAEGAAGLQMISEYTVPWVTVENAAARVLAVEWTQSKKEHIASSGWCSYSGLVATQPDEALDFAEIEALMGTIIKQIGGAANRVKYTMNRFIISVGIYVQPLRAAAKAVAEQIGTVSVDTGETACKVPLATAYIDKTIASNRGGKKRKTIRC